MGYMTLENFRTDLQSSLGDRGHDNSALDRWINFGYLDISGAIDFETLESSSTIATTSGNADIAAPSGSLIIKIVRDDTNDRLLGWLPKIEYFRRSTSDSGEPTHWTRNENDILLHPVPDGAYDINVIYRDLPTRLSAAGDTTVLPDMWDTAVHMLSVYHGLLASGEEERAQLWFARAVNFVQTRMSEDMYHATSAGLGLTLAPIRTLDIRPFVGQLGPGGQQQGGQ